MKEENTYERMIRKLDEYKKISKEMHEYLEALANLEVSALDPTQATEECRINLRKLDIGQEAYAYNLYKKAMNAIKDIKTINDIDKIREMNGIDYDYYSGKIEYTDNKKINSYLYVKDNYKKIEYYENDGYGFDRNMTLAMALEEGKCDFDMGNFHLESLNHKPIFRMQYYNGLHKHPMYKEDDIIELEFFGTYGIGKVANWIKKRKEKYNKEKGLFLEEDMNLRPDDVRGYICDEIFKNYELEKVMKKEDSDMDHFSQDDTGIYIKFRNKPKEKVKKK